MAKYSNKNGTKAADVLTYTKTGNWKAGAGNDVIYVKGGNMGTIQGEAGADTFKVSAGINNTLNGGAGADKYVVTGGSNILEGGTGNDTYSLNWTKIGAQKYSRTVINEKSAGSKDVDKVTISGANYSQFSLSMQYSGSNTALLLTDKNGNIVEIQGWNKKRISKITIGGIDYSYKKLTAAAKAGTTVNFTASKKSYTFDAAKTTNSVLNVKNSQMALSYSLMNLKKGTLVIEARTEKNKAIGTINIKNAAKGGVQKITVPGASATDVAKGIASYDETVARTMFLIGNNAKKTLINTTGVADWYNFVGTGYNVVLASSTQALNRDTLDFSLARDARTTRLEFKKIDADLKLRVFYYDDNDVEHTYGNVTVKNYYSSKTATNLGKTAGIRIKNSYKDLNNVWHTYRNSLYVDSSDKAVEFDTETYKKNAGITSSDRGITFLSGKGADKVVSYGKHDYISTNGGNDTVYVKNNIYGTSKYKADKSSVFSYSQIFTGAGNDKVYIGTTDKENDTAAKCSHNFVRTGTGDDIIDIRGDYNNIGSGDGADKVTVRGGFNKVNTHVGNDTIVLWSSGSWDSSDAKNFSGNNIVTGGAGNDTIYVRSNNGGFVAGDSGNDTYVIQFNRARNVIVDQGTAGQTDSDVIVLAGVDTTKLADLNLGMMNGNLSISGVSEYYYQTVKDGDYNYNASQSVEITVKGWNSSSNSVIKLLDIDNKKTLTYSIANINAAIKDAEATFADVTASADSLTSTETSQLTTLKLYSNSSNPTKTSL